MSENDWMLDPSQSVTAIEFEFLVDGMIGPDGRTPNEVQAQVIDAIEAAASDAASKAGASVTEVKWTVSRRRRT